MLYMYMWIVECSTYCSGSTYKMHTMHSDLRFESFVQCIQIHNSITSMCIVHVGYIMWHSSRTQEWHHSFKLSCACLRDRLHIIFGIHSLLIGTEYAWMFTESCSILQPNYWHPNLCTTWTMFHWVHSVYLSSIQNVKEYKRLQNTF